MAVNWGALGAFAAGAALLVSYELLRPRVAMAAPGTLPPPQPQPQPAPQPAPQSPPAPPIPPPANGGTSPAGQVPGQVPPGGARMGYDLDTGDRLSVYVRGPRAQATTTSDEIREMFRRLGYDVLVTSNGPGTADFAYRTVEIVGASYESRRVPADLAADVRVSSVATAIGNPKGQVLS